MTVLNMCFFTFSVVIIRYIVKFGGEILHEYKYSEG